MKNFNNLNASDLLAIIENRKHIVINIDVITANTANEIAGVTKKIDMLYFPQKQINEVISSNEIDITNNRKKLESFLILLENVGAEIWYRNDNATDCTIDIQFPN